MLKVRSRKALIIAKLIGVVLLAVAANIGKDAFQKKAVEEKDVFSITGRVRFLEKTGEGLWSKKQVLVQVEDYPASFFMDTESDRISETHFNSLLVTATDTARMAVHKDDLALLYTTSTLRLYGLFLQNGKAVYSYNDAFHRDKQERVWLYIQAGICLLGGLILLFLPKKYLSKE